MRSNSPPSDVREALRWARRCLRGAVDSPEVEAEILLTHVLGRSRAQLYARSDDRLSAEAAERLGELVARRAGGEPLQYLTGHQAFRRLDLAVGPGVLVPRPETEMVVEHALGRIAGVASPVVVDVGTGSGAIALSVGVERPDATVWATEVSADAAAWARRNLDRLGAGNVTIAEGDLFSPLPASLRGAVDLVVANPPYLAAAQLAGVAADVRDHEPLVATVSGPSGLEVPARVVEEALAWIRPGGWLVMETWPGQSDDLLALLSARYAKAAVHPDLTGSLRIAEGQKRPSDPVR
ncbi:MAG: release factor glutamine methyltransferase [Actinomycetota bacterium]|nr:release factor glutamine methyltransferase [Actinomycetota bacterium]